MSVSLLILLFLLDHPAGATNDHRGSSSFSSDENAGVDVVGLEANHLNKDLIRGKTASAKEPQFPPADGDGDLAMEQRRRNSSPKMMMMMMMNKKMMMMMMMIKKTTQPSATPVKQETSTPSSAPTFLFPTIEPTPRVTQRPSSPEPSPRPTPIFPFIYPPEGDSAFGFGWRNDYRLAHQHSIRRGAGWSWNDWGSGPGPFCYGDTCYNITAPCRRFGGILLHDYVCSWRDGEIQIMGPSCWRGSCIANGNAVCRRRGGLSVGVRDGADGPQWCIFPTGGLASSQSFVGPLCYGPTCFQNEALSSCTNLEGQIWNRNYCILNSFSKVIGPVCWGAACIFGGLRQKCANLGGELFAQRWCVLRGCDWTVIGPTCTKSISQLNSQCFTERTMEVCQAVNGTQIGQRYCVIPGTKYTLIGPTAYASTEQIGATQEFCSQLPVQSWDINGHFCLVNELLPTTGPICTDQGCNTTLGLQFCSRFKGKALAGGFMCSLSPSFRHAVGPLRYGEMVFKGNPKYCEGEWCAVPNDSSRNRDPRCLANGGSPTSAPTISLSPSLSVEPTQAPSTLPTTNNKTWDQKGADIVLDLDSNFPIPVPGTVAIDSSSDGSVVAAGLTGQVQVYQYTNGVWAMLGQTLAISVEALALAGNGMRLVVSATSSMIQVYEYSPRNDAWVLASTIVGSSGPSASLSMSADGSRFVVGGAYYRGQPNGPIRVYQFNGQQVGNDIAVFGRVNGAVDISADGTVVAARFRSDNANMSARAYKYDAATATWSQLGQTIWTAGSSLYPWPSISLSGDGKRLVVGDAGVNLVRVFELQANQQWNQIGGDLTQINGFTFDTGIDVTISYDGSIVTYGAYGNGRDGEAHVVVFEYAPSTVIGWSQIGQSLLRGSDAGRVSAYFVAVALTWDGRTLVTGYINDFRTPTGGFGFDGRVRVFAYNHD